MANHEHTDETACYIQVDRKQSRMQSRQPVCLFVLRFYSPVNPIKTACELQIAGKSGSERPKMTWKQLTEGSQLVEALGYQPS